MKIIVIIIWLFVETQLVAVPVFDTHYPGHVKDDSPITGWMGFHVFPDFYVIEIHVLPDVRLRSSMDRMVILDQLCHP